MVARKDKRKKRPVVVSRHGSFRFQTGMVTASLLNRGFAMEDAREVARAVRDHLGSREKISTEALKTEIYSTVQRKLGDAAAEEFRRERVPADGVVTMIETPRGRFPFSKGVILRQLDITRLDLESASELVSEVERWVQGLGRPVLDEATLHAKVTALLTARHGPEHARRYQLIDSLRHARRPVVILIGGATGTGKSTLAMELAYRLGVVWVTSTDMVRETMRTVLSPDLVPGLHDHSFRGIVLGGQVLSDPRERVLAGFRQQAGQVTIGVRAVIQRAIRENAHIIIEGTHIAPPFWQYLPEGADASVAGFILAVPDERTHRERFPQRSQVQVSRAADTYLDAFQSVRWIHDDLLRLAEENEAVVLTNVDVPRTLTAAVDFLSRELTLEEDVTPLPRPSQRVATDSIPTLFLILDGLGDEPNPALGGLTPLAAAHTPTLRRLASSGGQGQVATSLDAQVPSTDDGIMALLGAREESGRYGRGLFEALGQGSPIPPEAVLLRGNLATVDADDAILDRRAGRIRDGVQDLLFELREVPLSGGIIGRIYPGHEHRVLVMLVGSGLSPAVSDTDPGGQAAVERVNPPHPLDDTPEAARTAEALRELLSIAQRTLSAHALNQDRIARGLPAANAILTRGAASAPRLRTDLRRQGAMIAGCSTALGVARYIGLKTARSTAMTGNLDTDLGAKFRTAGELLPEHELVVIHIKGTDVAAHDRRPLEKRDFISAVDRALAAFLTANADLSGRLRIVVSADHGTSSVTGRHLPDPVPLLLATWQADVDDEDDFDEESSARGALGLLECGDLAEMLGLAQPAVAV